MGEDKRSVGWMEKYTPKGMQMLAKFYSDPANKQLSPPYEIGRESLVKRPGAGPWVSAANDPIRASEIKRLPPKNGDSPMVVAP